MVFILIYVEGSATRFMIEPIKALKINQLSEKV